MGYGWRRECCVSRYSGLRRVHQVRPVFRAQPWSIQRFGVALSIRQHELWPTHVQ